MQMIIDYLDIGIYILVLPRQKHHYMNQGNQILDFKYIPHVNE